MTSAPLDQAMTGCLERLRAGRLAEAETICRQILARQPDDADAWHLLGIIADGAGRPGKAAEFFQRAIAMYRRSPRVDPRLVDAYGNLGNALQKTGQSDAAIAAYREALRLDPNHAATHGNLGAAFETAGRLGEAIAAHRSAIRLSPSESGFHFNLANALVSSRQLDEATCEYREALRLRPDYPEALNNLGSALQKLGRSDEALACFHRFAALRPESAAAHGALGAALLSARRFEEAIHVCRQALRLEPNSPAVFNTLGCALEKIGKLAEAIDAYRQAVHFQPGFADAHNNLGICLSAAAQYEAAADSFREALRLKPDEPAIHSNFAKLLQSCHRIDEAIETCRRALALDPDHAEAHSTLGVCLKDQGRIGEALDQFRKAMALDPGDARIHSNFVYTVCFDPGFDSRAILDASVEWERRHAASLGRSAPSHENSRLPRRRVRIGYVSPDFRKHVVGRNLLPLLRCHDHEAFEIFGYADVLAPDSVTADIRTQCDQWRDLAGIDDDRAAEMIRADGIDILVDLTLHMARSRLLVFARKPAPIQVTYLGYCGTTGLQAMDYRLSDPHLDPLGTDLSCYRETTLRLPRTYWCYEPGDHAPGISPLPADSSGRPTFGCLNNFAKVSKDALDLWLEILRATPDSQLVLHVPEGQAQTAVRHYVTWRGIAADRLQLVGMQPWSKYFRTLQDLDVALDPFPYGGGITTCDSLWMGVPVVSLSARTAVGRCGCSILSNLGLVDLIAETRKQYLDLAVALIKDRPRLRELRSHLRNRMERSPLRDAESFARDIEAAYREMWRKWCEQAGP